MDEERDLTPEEEEENDLTPDEVEDVEEDGMDPDSAHRYEEHVALMDAIEGLRAQHERILSEIAAIKGSISEAFAMLVDNGAVITDNGEAPEFALGYDDAPADLASDLDLDIEK